LAPFLKTTGSRGLHVVVPLDRKWEFERVRTFARGLAEVIARQRPEEVTMEMLKRNRGGRLFLDVNRNGTAQTAVPAFAVRARDGAPGAMPIYWDELRDPKLNARTFTIGNAVERVKHWNDPWRGMSTKAKSLRAAEVRLRALAPQ